MKFYSELTDKIYSTVDELKKAESEYMKTYDEKAMIERKNREKKEKLEKAYQLTKITYDEAKEAYHRYAKALEDYNAIKNKYYNTDYEFKDDISESIKDFIKIIFLDN